MTSIDIVNSKYKLSTLADNQEILYYYDSYMVDPRNINKTIFINCRNTFIMSHGCYECKECKGNCMYITNEIKLITHTNKCSRPHIIKTMKKILTNPIDYISIEDFNMLPTLYPTSFFKVGINYGIYEKHKQNYQLRSLGKFIKVIDTNTSPHDESPFELYFLDSTQKEIKIEFEFFEHRDKMKFVELN